MSFRMKNRPVKREKKNFFSRPKKKEQFFFTQFYSYTYNDNKKNLQFHKNAKQKKQ